MAGLLLQALQERAALPPMTICPRKIVLLYASDGSCLKVNSFAMPTNLSGAAEVG
jgi:hypothetical protein